MPTRCFKFSNIEKATGVYLPKQINSVYPIKNLYSVQCCAAKTLKMQRDWNTTNVMRPTFRDAPLLLIETREPRDYADLKIDKHIPKPNYSKHG